MGDEVASFPAEKLGCKSLTSPAGDKLKLLLYNLRTGHLEVYELDLTPAGEGLYQVFLPHSLYHRVVTHFGRGPHTTAFTLTKGSYLLHGHLKSDKKAKITVEFHEES